jgi:hypothetical protein
MIILIFTAFLLLTVIFEYGLIAQNAGAGKFLYQEFNPAAIF